MRRLMFRVVEINLDTAEHANSRHSIYPFHFLYYIILAFITQADWRSEVNLEAALFERDVFKVVAGIVSIGDAGALGIVAEGGERGGEKQGKDGLGCGFNFGVGAAITDERIIIQPGLWFICQAGIAGVGAVFDRGFEVVEGKEGVAVQLVGVIEAIHCEADVAGVGDGNGGVRDCPETVKVRQAGLQGKSLSIRMRFVFLFRQGADAGFKVLNIVFQIAVGEDGGVERFHFTALCRDELGQAGEDAGRVELPGSGVVAFVIFCNNHGGTSFLWRSQFVCDAVISGA